MGVLVPAALLATLAAASAATVPGLEAYRLACTSAVQAAPARFFGAARGRSCAQAKTDFRRFALRWHPDRKPAPWDPRENPDGLTEPEQQRLFQCANGAHQRLMLHLYGSHQTCPSAEERPRRGRRQAPPTPDVWKLAVFVCMLFVRMIGIFASCIGAIALTVRVSGWEPCGWEPVDAPPPPRAAPAAVALDVQEHPQHHLLGVWRVSGRMILLRSTPRVQYSLVS